MSLIREVPQDTAQEVVNLAHETFFSRSSFDMEMDLIMQGRAGRFISQDHYTKDRFDILIAGSETFKFIYRDCLPRIVVKIPNCLQEWKKVIKNQMNGFDLMIESACPNMAPLTKVKQSDFVGRETLCQYWVEGEDTYEGNINPLLGQYGLRMADFFVRGNAKDTLLGIVVVDFGMIQRKRF